MAEKKKIPCRVCGELFEPCAYCQSHADVFRWRNFACSIKCATKYINDTNAYRESLKRTKETTSDTTETSSESAEAEKYDAEVSAEKNTMAKRKYNKKASTETDENNSE